MKTPRFRKAFTVPAVVLLSLLGAQSAAALSLSANYSQFGNAIDHKVYQNAAGQLFRTSGVGRTDVTALFQLNVAAANTYLEHAITVPWNHEVTYKLFDFKTASIAADGDSEITYEDENNRTTNSIIRIDSSANSHFFLDPTPFDNSEYNFKSSDAPLGGGSVNVERFGKAIPDGPADGRTDLLTLFLHETMHSLGLSDGSDRFVALVGQTGKLGDPSRMLTIPTSLSTLPSAFDIPFLSNEGHIDGAASDGLFLHTVVSVPAFIEGDRALPTGAEIYALAQINGATSTQYNLDLFQPTMAFFGMPWNAGILKYGL